MRRALVLPGIDEAGVALQLLLELLHLGGERVERALLVVEHLAELLQQVLLLGEADLQLHEALVVHGGRGYPVQGARVKSERHLERATEYLARGRADLAESALSAAIDEAVAEEDLVQLTRARMELGALLADDGRGDEALPFLQAVVRTERADGSVDAEVKRAAALLRRLRGGDA